MQRYKKVLPQPETLYSGVLIFAKIVTTEIKL